jgi:hypothetical protein
MGQSNEISKQALEPEPWAKAARVHDWRNYIGVYTQAIWHTFSDEQKLALAHDMELQASLEDWE